MGGFWYFRRFRAIVQRRGRGGDLLHERAACGFAAGDRKVLGATCHPRRDFPSILAAADREVDRRCTDLVALEVFDRKLQRVLAVVDSLRQTQVIADEEVAARALTILFRGREFVVVDALAAGVEDLETAPQRGMEAARRLTRP